MESSAAIATIPDLKGAPASALQEIRIRSLETAIPENEFPGLLCLRIQTDVGISGCGETCYAPHAVAAMIHDWMGRRLLGANALDIAAHTRFLYERATNFGSRGCELRAISAIDLALWDILGQVCGRPVWQLLGGKSQPSIPVYNSSAGPGYGSGGSNRGPMQGWPGHGEVGERGELNDYWSALHEPVEYAQALLAEGYTALKVWPLDPLGQRPGGPLQVSRKALRTLLRPLFQIREKLGDELEIALDGHGFFQLPAAIRIAKALEPLELLWIEDLIRPDCVDTLRDFRERIRVPVAASEMLIGPDEYRLVLEKRAADYLMVDPTWVGGISQTQRLTQLAQFHNVPVVMHDCTGPLTLLAGIHVATANGNVAWQETVRAHLRLLYPRLIDRRIEVQEGRIVAPNVPGMGVAWLEALFDARRSDVRISRMS